MNALVFVSNSSIKMSPNFHADLDLRFILNNTKMTTPLHFTMPTKLSTVTKIGLPMAIQKVIKIRPLHDSPFF